MASTEVPPGSPLTAPAPHIEMRGDKLRPVFASSGAGVGVREKEWGSG